MATPTRLGGRLALWAGFRASFGGSPTGGCRGDDEGKGVAMVSVVTAVETERVSCGQY